MKEILETIILNIVDDKSAVSVEQKGTEERIIYEVKVAAKDMGRVIGRQGRVAQAIRTLIKSLGARENKKVVIEFIG